MRNELFRKRLQEELVERTGKNPKFSIRVFAQQLGVESSSLTQIINGKRPLTDKMCQRLANKLELSPDEVESLMGVRREDRSSEHFPEFTNINVDMFKIIADWYHYAILELTYLSHFQGDPKWIAKVLGITKHEARAAIERLQRADFLEITEDGKWIDRLGDANNLGNEFTAPAFRKLQRQILIKATDALDTTPYEERVQSSMTLPVSKKRINEAKAKVLSFIEEMDQFLRAGDEQDEIYNMSFSLYPISNTTRTQK